MDRRKAIKRISLSFGSMTVSTGLISIVQSCQSDDSLNNLKFFNTTQISFLDRVLEIILPETETPGAISLNLSKFIDKRLSIPRFGKLEKTESLNVANALSIVLSENARKSIEK